MKASKKKRFIEAEDVTRLEIITSVAMSPDESKVAYTVETVSDDKQKYYARLFLVDSKSGVSKQYTFGDVNDHSPVFSPCGKSIAFISTRDKKSGIYVIDVEGGAERKVIEADGAFSSLNWTPDGQELVYVFRYNDMHDIEDEKKKKEVPLYRHITRIFYRLDGSGFLPKDRFHIWSVDVGSGKSKQLTKGIYDDHSPAISPNGKRLTFVSNRDKYADIEMGRDDLWILPLKGGKEKKIKTPPGPIAAPAFSPDSKMIAYVGHDKPEDVWGAINHHVWTVGIHGRPAARDIMPKFDRDAFDSTIGDISEGFPTPPLYWTTDGKRIYFGSSDSGSTNIFYVPSKGGLPTRVTHKKCHVKNYSCGDKRKNIAAIYSDLSTPSELQLMPATYGGDKKAKMLAVVNKELFAQIKFPKTKEVWFKAHDGFKLQGWLVTPPNFNPNKKYPAILEIHGGPRTQYGFTFYHEMLYLASKGYVVFYTNPRGGKGYGETFADAISGGWGEIDYYDCMSAADYLDDLPFVNKNKTGVTGGSYGGYMTNWIVGHTNRFKGAVTQRSVVNLESFFGSSDIGYTLNWEFDGYPWKNQENYRKCSPITYASKIKTPLLIIHSESDLRCGIEQAENLFATLKIMRKKVEMVRFPEEPHGLSRHGRPDRRIARLEWILKWFDKYVK